MEEEEEEEEEKNEETVPHRSLRRSKLRRSFHLRVLSCQPFLHIRLFHSANISPGTSWHILYSFRLRLLPRVLAHVTRTSLSKP